MSADPEEELEPERGRPRRYRSHIRHRASPKAPDSLRVATNPPPEAPGEPYTRALPPPPPLPTERLTPRPPTPVEFRQPIEHKQLTRDDVIAMVVLGTLVSAMVAILVWKILGN